MNMPMTPASMWNIMKSPLPMPNRIRHAASLACVGLAVLVAVGFLEHETRFCRGALCRTSSFTDPDAKDFAHAIPALPPGMIRSESRPEGRTAKPMARGGLSVGAWYRCALPLSTACFLLSFGIWSLQSQPNHAIRPFSVTGQQPPTQPAPVPAAET